MLAKKLQGSHLTLVPEIKQNAKFLIPWLKDKTVMRFVDHEGFGYSLKEEVADLKFVKKHDWSELHYIIFDEDKKPVGAAGLELNEFHKSGEIWLLIGEKSAWGKGYGQECIQILGDYFFNKLKYNRLELAVSKEFTKGVLAYKKAGFKVEGVIRKAEWDMFGKKFRDQVLMSILKEEWNNKKINAKRHSFGGLRTISERK